jgi:hypothetical protein
MPNVTFAVPERMHKEMRRHAIIKWPEVLRQAIARELELLDAYDRIFAQSEMTEEQAIALGREARRAAAQRSRKTQ